MSPWIAIDRRRQTEHLVPYTTPSPPKINCKKRHSYNLQKYLGDIYRNFIQDKKKKKSKKILITARITLKLIRLITGNRKPSPISLAASSFKIRSSDHYMWEYKERERDIPTQVLIVVTYQYTSKNRGKISFFFFLPCLKVTREVR